MADKSRNRLISKTILRSYFPYFLIALVLSLSLLVEVILVTALAEPTVSTHGLGAAIGSIAITTPIISLMLAILTTFVIGTSKKFTIAIGRGDKKLASEIFSRGFWSIVVVGLFLSLVMFFAGEYIVDLFGAKAGTDLTLYAASYLKIAAFSTVFTALSVLYIGTLGAYGDQRPMFVGTLVSLVSSTIFSVIFAKNTPLSLHIFFSDTSLATNSEMTGIALGSVCGALLNLIVCLIAKAVNKVDYKLVLFKPSFKQFISTFEYGIGEGSSLIVLALGSMLLNTAICYTQPVYTGAMNNPLNELFIALTFVKCAWYLVKIPADAMGLATSPMIRMFYASKDKTGVKSIFGRSMLDGILFTIGWAVIVMGAAAIAVAVGDSKYAGIANNGLMITLPFLIIYAFAHMLSSFYKATGKKMQSTLIDVVPMGIIFPLVSFIILAIDKGQSFLGVDRGNALWFPMGLSIVLYLLIHYVVLAIKNKKFIIGVDNYMMIGNEYDGHIAQIDVSIRDNRKDIAELAEKVHTFFKEQNISSRTSYMAALCIDELANDIVNKEIKEGKNFENESYLDIKIISNEDKLKIIIRDASKPYNPLDYDKLNPDFSKIGVQLVQKAADYIAYTRLYKMNIITIELTK